MPRISPTDAGPKTATWDPLELGLSAVAIPTSPAFVLSALIHTAGWPALTLYYTIAGAGLVTVRMGIFDSADPVEIQRRLLASNVAVGSSSIPLAGGDVYPAVRFALSSTSANTITAWLCGRGQ